MIGMKPTPTTKTKVFKRLNSTHVMDEDGNTYACASTPSSPDDSFSSLSCGSSVSSTPSDEGASRIPNNEDGMNGNTCSKDFRELDNIVLQIQPEGPDDEFHSPTFKEKKRAHSKSPDQVASAFSDDFSDCERRKFSSGFKGVTRSIRNLKKRGATKRERLDQDDATTLTGILSHGQKSVLTTATGFTESSGTTCVRANTTGNKHIKRRKDNIALSIPESISMNYGDDTENMDEDKLRSMVLYPSEMVSPNQMDPKKRRAMMPLSQEMVESTLSDRSLLALEMRRKLVAKEKAEQKMKKQSLPLGIIQNFFECCNVNDVID